MPKTSNFLNKQFLTLEDGRLRPKRSVFLKIFIKWQVLKTLLSVLNIDKPHKDWKWKWN
jgi:hypothetical protein